MMTRVDRAVAVDLVRDAYGFIDDVQHERRDDYELGFAERFADTFELQLPPSYPEGEQVFRGSDGLTRWIEGIREIWDEWRMEQERFIPTGDRVVVLIRIVARGELSGVELDRETAHVWSVEDGRVTRCVVYFERSEVVDELSGA
jgi:ketosteroid isomerase-like protein